LNFSRLHVHNFNGDFLKSTFCDLLSLCTQRFNCTSLAVFALLGCCWLGDMNRIRPVKRSRWRSSNEVLLSMTSRWSYLFWSNTRKSKPRSCTTSFGPRSFGSSGLTAWNDMPSHLRNLDLTLSDFRQLLIRNSAIAHKPRGVFRRQSRSPNMVPFHTLGMVSC